MLTMKFRLYLKKDELKNISKEEALKILNELEKKSQPIQFLHAYNSEPYSKSKIRFTGVHEKEAFLYGGYNEKVVEKISCLRYGLRNMILPLGVVVNQLMVLRTNDEGVSYEVYGVEFLEW